jgi:S-adenosylmethionine synthetase
MNYHFSSESVSEGHPDKICDQLSDAILDAYLYQDPNARVAVECLITSGKLIIAGEVSSTAKINAIQIAKKQLLEIGYNEESVGFNAHTAIIENLIHQQSPEINFSVQHGGAGDQGIMFGYATNETDEYMPMPIVIAHELIKKQTELRKSGAISWLRPDAKSQVTILYENNKPKDITSVVFSTQHAEDVNQKDIIHIVNQEIIQPVIQLYFPDGKPVNYINPSGSFTLGGPHSDTGLTGRKIIVDTYGGACPHGGGAFSGKDPSKVDRSAAYAARFVALHIVAARLAEKCTIQLSYAIGKTQPVSVYVYTHQTGKLKDEIIAKLIEKTFDLTPNGISETLQLKNPIYLPTSTCGHFGNKNFPWEKIHSKYIDELQFF